MTRPRKKKLTAEERARFVDWLPRQNLKDVEVVTVDSPAAMAVPLPPGTVAVGFADPKHGGPFAVRTRSGAHLVPNYFWLPPHVVLTAGRIEVLCPDRCAKHPLAFFVKRTEQPCTEIDQ
jgi:hypothetical protein